MNRFHVIAVGWLALAGWATYDGDHSRIALNMILFMLAIIAGEIATLRTALTGDRMVRRHVKVGPLTLTHLELSRATK